MDINTKSHWEEIYKKKKPNEVSWTQETPQTSIDFLASFNLPQKAAIIDVGAGESKFVDYLLSKGYTNITVLDISKNAIDKAKRRIGISSEKVKWLVTDINEFIPNNKFDFWHDRAVFHFLTNKDSISRYSKMVSCYASNIVVGSCSAEGDKIG